jgi:hypothetical protein
MKLYPTFKFHYPYLLSDIQVFSYVPSSGEWLP